MKAVLIVIVVFLLLPVLGQDGVRFSGTLEKDTDWSDIVFVEGDLYVKPGVTLTIAPGTRVLFKSNVRGYDKGVGLYVRGTLIAKGQRGTGQIVFTSAANQPRPHDWFGIVMNGVRSSVMQYCVVEYAYNGISCANSTMLIDNCTLRFNQYAGINCEFSASPVIQHTALLSNGFAGVVCELRSNPVIQYCHILLNANGLVVADKSAPDLGRAAPQPTQSAGFNHIYDNKQFNVYHHSGADIYAQNNYWNQIAREHILPTIDDGVTFEKYGRVLFEPFFPEEAILASAEPPRIPAGDLLLKPVAQSASAAVSPEREGRTSFEVIPTKSDVAEPPLPPETVNLSGNPKDRSGRDVGEQPAAAAATGIQSSAETNAAAAPSEPDEPPKHTAIPGGPDEPVKHVAASNERAKNAITKPLDRNPADLDSIKPPGDRPSVETAGREKNPVAATNKTPVAPGDLSVYPEALLDGGQREYLRKINPEYPRIHLKSANEGVVLIEVTVGRDGRIESYRVLRSDGSAFQEAAEQALRQYRYKPGKIHNRAVKFQVVERFEFMLD